MAAGDRDTDVPTVAGLDVPSFHLFARLSGLVPLVGIASGRCFAGNDALSGCCDVVIATRDSNIGMGGPAMIEGGGLGVFRPEEIGPLPVQVANGVVDVAVVIDTLADTGSVLELRPEFGVGIVTALVRVAGRALGLFANNPMHLGGAIDADAADKAALPAAVRRAWAGRGVAV